MSGMGESRLRGIGPNTFRSDLVRRCVTLLVAVAMLVAVVVQVPRANASPPAGTPVFADADGIHVVAVSAIDDRQYNVRVSSAALGRAVDVRILLPTGYAADAVTRYPVLYLFHGTSGRASDWVTMGDAEATTAPLPLITVMPDAGFDGNGGGWFTNWVDTATALGPSQWETFHVGQLIPWVDANLRTVAGRNGRAVAGLSQGGFGSTTYPARHPDMFISAASFSGAPDIDYDPVVAVGATAVIQATALGLDRVEPDAMFGSRATAEINWQGHDPADLVTNLRGVDVWLFTATGAPGPYDPPSPNLGAMGIESITHGSTLSFYQRAQQLAVPVHLNDYVYGTHIWPYWARDLREYVGPLMQTFAYPPAPPAATSYQSIDQSWSQWGWSVALQRAAVQQFSYLTDGRPEGFTLQGTGTATTVTPPFYTPASVETVTLTGASGTSTFDATADSTGRLHLTLPLGGIDIPGPLGGIAVIGLPGVLPLGGSVTVTIRPSQPGA
jgi:S-formylglutathione hydrolase FrmB